MCCVAATTFFGCSQEGPLLPESTGKINEILVVMDTAAWGGVAGDAIRGCFNEIQHGLPQEEVYFRLINVPKSAFGRIFRSTRNIVFVNIEDNLEPRSGYSKNQWAKNQLILTVNGKTAADVEAEFLKNKLEFLYLFRNEEVDRLVKRYKRTAQKELKKVILDKHGVDLSVPPGYLLALDKEDFTWLRKDKEVGEHAITQSLLLYTIPYTDSALTTTNLILMRNAMTKSYIPGGAEGSYQKCFEEYPVLVSEITVDSLYTKEVRGLWNMHREFMGGPFVHYAVVKPGAQDILIMDAFCYAPNFDKRDQLIELESIAKTLSWK